MCIDITRQVLRVHSVGLSKALLEVAYQAESKAPHGLEDEQLSEDVVVGFWPFEEDDHSNDWPGSSGSTKL